MDEMAPLAWTSSAARSKRGPTGTEGEKGTGTVTPELGPRLARTFGGGAASTSAERAGIGGRAATSGRGAGTGG